VLLDRVADQLTQLIRLDRVQLNAVGRAKRLGARVGLLGRPAWQRPRRDLVGLHRDAFEHDGRIGGAATPRLSPAPSASSRCRLIGGP
jgi:hypothetical protein